jgi:ABC-2 type transport system permease protein
MSTFTVMLRQRIRRDRVTVPIWIVCTGLLGLFSASSIAQTYGGQADRVAILRLAATNPALLALRGLPEGTSIDAFNFFEIYTYLALLAAFMSTFLAVRHTRAEEESGRAELIASTPAARTVPTVATLVHGILANLLLGLFAALCLIAGKLDAGGSFVTGAALAATGITFLGIGMLASQFMRTSRAANSLSVAVIGAAYFLRAIGDAMGTVSSDGLHVSSGWPSWLSPLGWGQQTNAYTTNNLAPLLLNLALAVVCIAAVFVIQGQRDSGASLLAGAPGRAEARPALSGSFGLGWRLQWPTIVGWCIGGFAFGALIGTVSGVLTSASTANAGISNALKVVVPGTGGQTLTQTFIVAIFEFIGALAAACAIQAIMRMRQEESLGTAELLLSTPITRVRWLSDYLLLGLVAIGLVLVSGALGSGLSLIADGQSSSLVGDSLAVAAAQLPAALIYLAVLALVFVLAPSLTIALGWTLFGLGIFIGPFGGLIGLPRWVQDISPFVHTPVPLGSQPDWSGGIWMLLISIVVAAAAILLIRQRDLRTN